MYDIPGVIVYDGKTSKTTKVKKFIQKNNIVNPEIHYVENPSSDFRIMNQQMQELEDKILGIIRKEKEKEVFQPEEEFEYQYRANVNTVYKARDLITLQKLLDWNHILIDVYDLYKK